ncbi:class I glutamine amidotransferase [delta proteobacterium NaphS2]|nr:class I glutamine amidotransferase [delta proteobacterium NaphS2]
MSIFMGQDTGLNILVIQNSDEAPGGVFVEKLEKGGTITTLNPQEGDFLPDEPGIYAGLVVLGGPQHGVDDGAGFYFGRLMELMRRFERSGKPVMGICLGCQLLARAHGKSPYAMGSLEMGFVQHEITAFALKDPVLRRVDLPPLMEFHEDTFDLPESAVLLIRGDACPNQGFRVGQVSYGFQFHFEVNLAIAKKWVTMFRSKNMDTYEKYRAQFDAQTLNEIEGKLDTYIAGSEAFCERIAENWLALASRQRLIR